MIYIVSGRARMRWGERLEFTAEAGPGDFIYVQPYVPHQEINASPIEPLYCVLVISLRRWAAVIWAAARVGDRPAVSHRRRR